VFITESSATLKSFSRKRFIAKKATLSSSSKDSSRVFPRLISGFASNKIPLFESIKKSVDACIKIQNSGEIRERKEKQPRGMIVSAIGNCN